MTFILKTGLSLPATLISAPHRSFSTALRLAWTAWVWGRTVCRIDYRLPLSRLGIIQTSLTSALAASSVGLLSLHTCPQIPVQRRKSLKWTNPLNCENLSNIFHFFIPLFYSFLLIGPEWLPRFSLMPYLFSMRNTELRLLKPLALHTSSMGWPATYSKSVYTVHCLCALVLPVFLRIWVSSSIFVIHR